MTELQREQRTAELTTADLIAWLREEARVTDLSTSFIEDEEDQARARSDAARLLEVADRLAAAEGAS